MTSDTLSSQIKIKYSLTLTGKEMLVCNSSIGWAYYSSQLNQVV